MSPTEPFVLVVGSVNVDLTLRLPRLPRPGETVSGARSLRSLGGKGANQAAAVARLGGRAVLRARVGSDPDGRFARDALGRAGVDTTAILVEAGEPTGTAAVLLDADGENLIGVAPGANAGLTAADVAALSLRPGAVVANLEVPLAAVRAAGQLARQAGCPFVLNPAPAGPLPADLLALVDVLTPNEHEYAELDLAGFTGRVVLTRGRHGLRLIEGGRTIREVPAYPVPTVDSTGAGDACTGALAWALAAGQELDEALQIGAAVGALSTRAVGAQAGLPTWAEVAGLLDG